MPPKITERNDHFIGLTCMYQSNCGMSLEDAKEEARKSLGMITNEMRQTILQQIGIGNILSISGGRSWPTDTGICLPVGSGYRVAVDLDLGSDTYTVRRVFVRNGQEWEHGRRENVYCDEVGEVAYKAGMFRSWNKDEWMCAA